MQEKVQEFTAGCFNLAVLQSQTSLIMMSPTEYGNMSLLEKDGPDIKLMNYIISAADD